MNELTLHQWSIGNRCGHDPHAPKFFEWQPSKKPRPKLLLDAAARVENFFYTPRDWMQRLYFSRKERSKAHMRSERREAICLILGAILNYCDLRTLQIGVPNAKGGMQPIKWETIANKAGLSLRRAERALQDLIKIGYLSTKERRSKREGNIFSLSSIKKLSPAFFLDLGFTLSHLKYCMKKAKNRHQKKLQESYFDKYATPNEEAHQRYQNYKLGKVMEGLKGAFKKGKDRFYRNNTQNKAIEEAKRRRYTDLLIEYAKDNTLSSNQKRRLAWEKAGLPMSEFIENN